MTTDLATSLTTILRDVFAEQAVVDDVRRGPVGNGQETWFCRVETASGSHPVVVRRSAASGPLDWTDRAAEYAALAWLQPHGLPTPPVLHFEPAGGRLDRPAIVMAHMPGEPLRTSDQEIRDPLVADLGSHLARLHAIDAAGFGSGDVADMGAATTGQLDFWERRYREDALTPIPLLGALLAWLRANQPVRSGPSCVLWGDPGPYNVLHEGGAISALLDWELVHTGDPLEDLGAAVWSCRGVADPEILIGAYEEAAGTAIDRDALQWFETFSAIARATMLVRGARSVVTGDLPRPSMMGLSLDLLPRVLNQAAAAAGWPVVEPIEETVESPESAADLRPDVGEILRGIALYVDRAVLAEVEDRFVRRNLKTIAALLRVSALRSEHEEEVAARRANATARFLARLASAGVDVTGGLEETAGRIESDEGAADHRAAMRRHLLEDQAMAAALLQPLRELYGSG